MSEGYECDICGKFCKYKKEYDKRVPGRKKINRLTLEMEKKETVSIDLCNVCKKKMKYMRDREGNKIGYTKEKTTKPLVMSMPEYRCEGCFAEIKRKDKFCSGCGRRIGWSKNEVN